MAQHNSIREDVRGVASGVALAFQLLAIYDSSHMDFGLLDFGLLVFSLMAFGLLAFGLLAVWTSAV